MPIAQAESLPETNTSAAVQLYLHLAFLQLVGVSFSIYLVDEVTDKSIK